VGYFNLETKQVVAEPVNDLIIPYHKNEVWSIVKRDTLYGWIDNTYQYHEGLPNEEADHWLKSFDFLPKDLRLKNDRQTFCEIPRLENAGYGIVMPPSYLVRTGVFSEIVGGISTTPVPLNGWTDYVETSGTFMQQVTEQINTVITTITSRFIEGREEFYTHNRLVFVNNRNDTLAVADIPTDGAIEMRKIGENLIEVKSPAPYYWFEGPTEDSSLPMYSYFSLGENLSVQELKTHRTFSNTAFVKLDSTYLAGKFNHWNPETNAEEETTFLSLSTLQYMRNEILASYGYKFTDPAEAEHFVNANWYQPRYDSIEEFHDQMTAVDQHNLAFLEKIMEFMKTNAV
jgi:hypothetical protein